jgi:dolichol-phosphate mannosyltransferase
MAATGEADIISGTRYPEGRSVEASVPQDRRDINRRITAMLNHRLGLSITDAFCGFKAYRVEALADIQVTVPGYAMPMQFWAQAARAKLRIVELPVRLIYDDPTRHFGGLLDDPAARFDHYLGVFEAEMAAELPVAAPAPASLRTGLGCGPCR